MQFLSNLMFSSLRHWWHEPILGIMFLSFGFIAPKHLKIIWLSNISILSYLMNGYSRNASCALNFIFTFLFQTNVVKDYSYQFKNISRLFRCIHHWQKDCSSWWWLVKLLTLSENMSSPQKGVRVAHSLVFCIVCP